MRVRLVVTTASISVSHQGKERPGRRGAPWEGMAWEGTRRLRLDCCFLGVPRLPWFPQARWRPHSGLADIEHHGMDEVWTGWARGMGTEWGRKRWLLGGCF